MLVEQIEIKNRKTYLGLEMQMRLEPCASGVVLGVTVGSCWVVIVVVGDGGGGDVATLVLVLVVIVVVMVVVVTWRRWCWCWWSLSL